MIYLDISAETPTSAQVDLFDVVTDETVGTVRITHDGEDLRIEVARNDESQTGSVIVSVA